MSRFSGAISQLRHPSSGRGVKRKRQPSHLPGDSINPLSHSPAVLKQFDVAGLPNTEHLPSDSVQEFPHRPLVDAQSAAGSCAVTTRKHHAPVPPPAATSQKGGRRKDNLALSLRECIQVCLERGDVHRAKKAIAALAHAESNNSLGHNGSCSWNLRAELIMREGQRSRQSSRDLDDQVGQEDKDGEESEDEGTQLQAWGPGKTVANLRQYLSSVISEQPSEIKSRAVTTMLLNLWWALLSAELYGASAEYTVATHTEGQDYAAGFPSGEHQTTPGPRLPSGNSQQPDIGDDVNRSQNRRMALRTTKMVVSHLEPLMVSNPYKDDQNLLNLYAAALLYAADLQVSSRHGSQTKRSKARLARNALRDRARGVLGNIAKLGGQVDPRLQHILDIGSDEE